MPNGEEFTSITTHEIALKYPYTLVYSIQNDSEKWIEISGVSGNSIDLNDFMPKAIIRSLVKGEMVLEADYDTDYKKVVIVHSTELSIVQGSIKHVEEINLIDCPKFTKIGPKLVPYIKRMKYDAQSVKIVS